MLFKRKNKIDKTLSNTFIAEINNMAAFKQTLEIRHFQTTQQNMDIILATESVNIDASHFTKNLMVRNKCSVVQHQERT